MSATAAVNDPTPHEPDVVARVIAERGHLDGPLMPVLHGVQDALGYVPSAAIAQIARALQLSHGEVHGVIGSYRHFRRQPARGPVLQVCRAESCRSMGGEALLQQARGSAHCTVEAVHCLGLCAHSPAVMLEGQPHARMTPERLDELLSEAGDFR